MDPAVFWTEAGKLGFVVLLLLLAVYFLWRRINSLERARDKRESQQREDCLETNRDLGARLRKLEDEGRAGMAQTIKELMVVIGKNASAWDRLADRLTIPDATPPRPMPAQDH